MKKIEAEKLRKLQEEEDRKKAATDKEKLRAFYLTLQDIKYPKLENEVPKIVLKNFKKDMDSAIEKLVESCKKI